MRTILVTGEHSYIGGAFAQRAAAFPDRYRVDKISLRRALCDADFSGYDCVLHVAGLAHVKYNDSMRERYMIVNRDLAIAAAKKAKQEGVRQFIFLSSMIVYGKAARAGKTRIIARDTAPAPENAYGQSKLEAEAGIRSLASEEFRVAILRVPTVYGKGCRGNYATLSRWAGRLPVFPDLPGKRSAIYVENLAEFLRLLVDDCAAGMFFPQDEKPVSATEFMREIARARGMSLRLTRLFNPILRIFGGCAFLRRAFGGIAYEREISEYPSNYRLVGFPESVRRAEE